jgi:transposase
VNAAHIKNVPGRKTDVADAGWIAQLAEHGLLRSSFVPPEDIRRLRSLIRHRATLVNERTRVIQRLEKALQDAGIKLTSVASTVLTKSGRDILEALVAGERDPRALANLARGRLRPKIPALAEALEASFEQHHALLVREGLAHVDFLDAAIKRVSAAIDQVLLPHVGAIQLLQTIPGVGKKVAEVIVAEIGVDMSRFPTAAHLASWAGMCPGNNRSAGKRGPGNTRPGSRWLRQALVEAGHAAARTQGSYLSVRHARISKRRGKQRAAIATGHAILVACWYVLTHGVHYQDLGTGHLASRLSPEVEAQRLVRRLEAIGHRVTLEPAA